MNVSSYTVKTHDNRASEPSAPPTPTIATTVTTTEVAPLNARQRRNQSRLREWRTKLEEPEDNSQSNYNNPDQRTQGNSILQQAAELLERSQQLLRSATAETWPPATTASRERRMSLVQLIDL